MNCIPKFSNVEISFQLDPTSPTYPPGEYLFAFKYFTRQVGWGIETQGKYPTNAAPSSANQIKDGWPTPTVKESTLTHPYRVVAPSPWNVVTFNLRFNRPPGPFVNVAYYMAQDPEGEFGRGQMGSNLSLVGNTGSRWKLIDEKPSHVTYNSIQFT